MDAYDGAPSRMEEPASMRRVSTCFVTRSADLGFDAPEVPLRLRVQPSEGAYLLTVACDIPHPLAEVTAWLEPYRPHRLEVRADGAIRAEIPDPPAAWRAAFEDVEVEMLQLTPDGTALAQVAGTRPAIAAFARRLTLAGRPPAKRAAPPSERAPLLTPSQDQALRAAVASGYYDIPRPVNLQQLATTLGVTSASLSERLRRAEGRVIKSFVKGQGSAPGAQTPLHHEAHRALAMEGTLHAEAEGTTPASPTEDGLPSH